MRLDAANRSLVSQALLSFDDFGYASNTSAVYRGDPFFVNTLLVADTLRATAGRLREDATRTLSMLSLGLRANISSHNQADHCIFAFPLPSSTHVPRTVNVPNHVFDASLCANSDGVQTSVGRFAAPALSAHAADIDAVRENAANGPGGFRPLVTADRTNTPVLAPASREGEIRIKQFKKIGRAHV